MGPTDDSRRHRRLQPQERRELIAQGAMELFAERGYENVSMMEIARAGGVTPAVIYDHFPAKAALAIELLERETEALLGFVGQAVETAPAEPAALFRAGVEAFFAYVEEHRFAWRILFRDPPSDPAVAAAYGRLNDRATKGIAFLLSSRGDAALTTFADPEQTAEIFAEGVKAAQNGLAAWWYEHPEVPRETLVERLMQLVWTGLGRVALAPPVEGS